MQRFQWTSRNTYRHLTSPALFTKKTMLICRVSRRVKECIAAVERVSGLGGAMTLYRRRLYVCDRDEVALLMVVSNVHEWVIPYSSFQWAGSDNIPEY